VAKCVAVTNIGDATPIPYVSSDDEVNEFHRRDGVKLGVESSKYGVVGKKKRVVVEEQRKW